MFVQFARKRTTVFRKEGLRLGKRRDNFNNNSSNYNNDNNYNNYNNYNRNNNRRN